MIRGFGFMLGCLSVILPVLKWFGVINISWGLALAPLWVPPVFGIALTLFIAFGALIVWIINHKRDTNL